MAPPGADRVHPVARGFDTAADAYERARPEYPANALRLLAERLDLGPASVVVELASGTGKLTRSLAAATPVRIIAVEPSEAMRAAFAASVPGVPVLDGTAERIPLGDGTVDAVVVGQAFHWFRAEEALSEIARVLRARGGLGLIYNTRDESVPWVRRFGDLLRTVRGSEVPLGRTERWRGAFEPPDRFDPLEGTAERVVHRIPAEALVDRALSVSYVAQLPEPDRERIAARVRRLLEEDPDLRDRATIEFPYVTETFWTRKR